MTLAEIRASGTSIELKPDGGMGVRGASPTVIEAIKQNKAAIIATLKRERLDGIDYHDSKVYWSLNVLYNNWYSLPESEERSSALRLCSKWDNALTDNFKAGAQMIIEEQPMLELLAESAPLEGHALRRTLSAMVGDMSQPVTPRTVSTSALDGPAHVAVAEPKQFGLLDEPAPAHTTQESRPVPQEPRRATYAGLG